MGLGTDPHQTINSLLELKKMTPVSLVDEPMGFSPTSRAVEMYDVPSSQILHRGQTFFDRVYGKVSKRVMGQMDRSGTEDLGLTARLVYGYLLSNINVLTHAETSYVLIAGLVPQDVCWNPYPPRASALDTLGVRRRNKDAELLTCATGKPST